MPNWAIIEHLVLAIKVNSAVSTHFNFFALSFFPNQLQQTRLKEREIIMEIFMWEKQMGTGVNLTPPHDWDRVNVSENLGALPALTLITPLGHHYMVGIICPPLVGIGLRWPIFTCPQAWISYTLHPT